MFRIPAIRTVRTFYNNYCMISNFILRDMKDTSKTYALRYGLSTIGRKSTAKIVITNRCVSRKHCYIDVNSINGKISISNLSSKGTRIYRNGNVRLVRGKTELRMNDILIMGGQFFELSEIRSIFIDSDSETGSASEGHSDSEDDIANNLNTT